MTNPISSPFILITSLILSFLLVGCSPMDENGGSLQPEQCNNGLRDAGEQGVDCGGICLPCPPAADCISEEGMAIFAGLLEGEVTEVYCDETSLFVSVLGTFGSLELRFFPGDFPVESKRYSMTGCVQPEVGKICAKVRLKVYPGLDFFATSGSLFWEQDAQGGAVANFCNVQFANQGSETFFRSSIRFRCK